MRIVTWNIGRGLIQKEKEISNFADKKRIQVFFLQETDFINDSKRPYQINDAMTTYFPLVKENEKTRLICLVDKDLNMSIKQRKDLMDNGLQSIWIELERKNKKNLLIGGFYREWGKTAEEKSLDNQENRLSAFLNQMERAARENKEICVLGDMNLDQKYWEDKKYYLSRLVTKLRSTLASLGLEMAETGITFEAYREGKNGAITSTLDHVYYSSNICLRVSVGEESMSDHFPVTAELKFQSKEKKKCKKKEISVRNIKGMSKDRLEEELLKIPWGCLAEMEDVDEMVEFYTEHLKKVLDILAPIKKIKLKSKKKLHLSKETCKYIKRRNLARKNKCKEEYKRLRNLCTKLVRRDQNETVKLQLDKDSNPKNIWRIANSFINPPKTIDVKITRDGQELGHEDTAEEFNVFFLNKVKKIRENVPKSNCCPLDGVKKRTTKKKYYFSLSTVHEEKIISVIKKLKNSAATGVDDIPTHMLKLGAKIIAVPLTWIINASISSGKFPSLWKKAKVIPLHKKNDVNVISNYRPVSNLCISSKVLEKVIHGQISHYFENKNLLPSGQHGFRKGFSTTSAVTSMHSRWSEERRRGNYIGICCFDLSSAFDVVDHDILLQKLKLYGLSNLSLKWIQSFLSGRDQVVKWKESTSRPIAISCGTPQGGILSPFLFLVMMADIEEYMVHSTVEGYADDVNTTTVGESEEEVVNRMQEDAKNMLNYMSINKLAANEQKTQVMIIGKKVITKRVEIGESNIEPQNCVDILGIKISQDLSWKNHINDVKSCLDQRIGLLRRLSYNMPKSVLRILADGLCLSKIRYCIAAYGQPKTCEMGKKICAMEDIQVKLNTIMRIITGHKREDRKSISDLLKETRLPSVNRMTIEGILKEMWMFLYVRGDTYIRDALLFKSNKSQMTTRSKTCDTLEVGFPMNSFIYHGPKLWNLFPEDGRKKTSKYRFKMTIKRLLTDQQFL